MLLCSKHLIGKAFRNDCLGMLTGYTTTDRQTEIRRYFRKIQEIHSIHELSNECNNYFSNKLKLNVLSPEPQPLIDMRQPPPIHMDAGKRQVCIPGSRS